MDPTVELRPARPEEAAAISRLLAASWRDDYAEHLGGRRTERLIADHCRVERIVVEISGSGTADGRLGWQVAERDGRVVGAAAGGITSSGSGEVYNLCIDPGHRRRGVGRALLQAVTGQQLARGAHQQWVNLHGDGTATAALPFLTSQGFQPTADGPDDGDVRLHRTI
jgi:ribosomal protein S18 acetylase RimI-like enzyme